MARINPYLYFNGNAQEVFEFYKSVFGGEFATVMRYGDMPGCEDLPEDKRVSDADKQKVMHIALPVGNQNVLMASDVIESMGQTFDRGNQFAISLSADSREEADRIFNALAVEGKTEMPLADTFWGAYFGMLEDKFGIQWMVSHDPKFVQN